MHYRNMPLTYETSNHALLLRNAQKFWQIPEGIADQHSQRTEAAASSTRAAADVVDLSEEADDFPTEREKRATKRQRAHQGAQPVSDAVRVAGDAVHAVHAVHTAPQLSFSKTIWSANGLKAVVVPKYIVAKLPQAGSGRLLLRVRHGNKGLFEVAVRQQSGGGFVTGGGWQPFTTAAGLRVGDTFTLVAAAGPAPVFTAVISASLSALTGPRSAVGQKRRARGGPPCPAASKRR